RASPAPPSEKGVLMPRKWTFIRALVVVASLLVCSAVSRAQGTPGFHIGVAGGALIPVEDQHDVFDIGWNATLLFPINFGTSPVGIRFEGSYGELTTKSSLVGFQGDGKSRIISGTFDLVIAPHLGVVQPYISGGVG